MEISLYYFFLWMILYENIKETCMTRDTAYSPPYLDTCTHPNTPTQQFNTTNSNESMKTSKWRFFVSLCLCDLFSFSLFSSSSVGGEGRKRNEKRKKINEICMKLDIASLKKKPKIDSQNPSSFLISTIALSAN